MRPTACFWLILICAAPLAAGTDRTRPSAGRRAVRVNATHFGASPFTPVDLDDTVFVVDDDFDLDTGCTYASGGPLAIHLSISRYVGKVKGDGTLADSSSLVARGFISPTARLRLPVFDVDMFGDPDDASVAPEVDRVFFNGHELGTLTGDNEIWKLNEFTIPIEWIKFPPFAGAPGLSPIPADNVIRIEIDEASGGVDNWCTSVDWTELELAALAPIFLVHGTAAQSDTWDPHFTNFFHNSGVLWSNAIDLEPNGAIETNGIELADQLQGLATSFGARRCHVVAHSKGGLDTRAYLNSHYDSSTLRVMSVYTISTPHHGTIISDVIALKRTHANAESQNADLLYLISHDPTLFGAVLGGPKDPALSNQTTGAMREFNRRYPTVPGNILFYNYGADADTNDDGTIDIAETAEFFPFVVPDSMRPTVALTLYRTIGNVASVQVTTGTRLWGLRSYTSIDIASANSFFALNDLVTSEESAHSPFGTYLGPTLAANHTSVKSEALASAILAHILGDFPNH